MKTNDDNLIDIADLATALANMESNQTKVEHDLETLLGRLDAQENRHSPQH